MLKILRLIETQKDENIDLAWQLALSSKRTKQLMSYMNQRLIELKVELADFTIIIDELEEIWDNDDNPYEYPKYCEHHHWSRFEDLSEAIEEIKSFKRGGIEQVRVLDQILQTYRRYEKHE